MCTRHGAGWWGNGRDHCIAQAHLSYRWGMGPMGTSVIQAPVIPIATPFGIAAFFSNALLFATFPLYDLIKLSLQVHRKFCCHHEVSLGPLSLFHLSLGALIPPHYMAFVHSSSRCWIYRPWGQSLYPIKLLYPLILQHPAHSKHLIHANWINLFWLKETCLYLKPTNNF